MTAEASPSDPADIQAAWTSSHVRRSVERDVRRWVGWDPIIAKRHEIASQEGVELGRVYDAIFSTGGRVSEALALRRDNFLLDNPGYVEVHDMKLEKHYDKKGGWTEKADTLPDTMMRRLYAWNAETGKWERRRYTTVRDEEAVRQDFVFPAGEALARSLADYLRSLSPGQRLFPSRTKPDVLMTRSFVYRKFIKHGIYPHWLRGQRASCLRSVYGYHLDDLMDWFSWLDLRTAKHYSKMGTEDQQKKFKEALAKESEEGQEARGPSPG